MSNELKETKKAGIATYLSNDSVKKNILSVVGSKSTPTFIASIVSSVQTNPQLAECTNPSILSAALLGESLKLTPSPQLGMFYMVPYNNKKDVVNPSTGLKEKVQVKEAMFQLGYKGYIQLAIRSGQYEKIVCSDVKDGELKYWNPITEEFEFEPILDSEKRSSLKTVGYYGMFKLVNGFRKELFMTREDMEQHAKKYSAMYRSDIKYGSSKSFWKTNFDMMAKKTMIRQLISKYGVMSVDMQTAYQSDMAIINEDGTADYADNKNDIQEVVEQEIKEKANQIEFAVDGEFVEDSKK